MQIIMKYQGLFSGQIGTILQERICSEMGAFLQEIICSQCDLTITSIVESIRKEAKL